MPIDAATGGASYDARSVRAWPALIALLEQQPDVAAAYVFGSRARGAAANGSDLDVAVLLAGDPDAARAFDRRLELMAMVDDVVATDVDVVVLNHAPVLLRHEVLRSGVLCCERDVEERVAFEVRTGKAYADSIPARRFFRDALLRELDSGGLGGRE